MKAKTNTAAKSAPLAPDIYPMGTVVQFTGYTDPSVKPKLKPGDTLHLGTYYPEDALYDVSKKAGGKPVDSITAGEFTVDDDTPELLIGGEAAGEVATPAVAKKSKGKPTKTKGTTPAPSKAVVAPKKGKVKKSKEEALEPVTVVASVKAAIKAAGNDAIAAAMTVMNDADTGYFRLGGILAVIQEKDLHTDLKDEEGAQLFDGGNKGFAKFVERHMGMQLRKAQYWTTIYRKFSSLGADEKKLAGIGWSKLKETLAYIDEDNLNEVLKLAKAESYAEFKATIRKRLVDSGKKRHGNTGNSHEMTSYRFSVHNDRASVLSAALDRAADTLGITKPSEDASTTGAALMHIVSEWASLQN